jgi:hypothetical protein
MMGLARCFEFSQRFDGVIKEEEMFGIILKLTKCGSGSKRKSVSSANQAPPPGVQMMQGSC